VTDKTQAHTSASDKNESADDKNSRKVPDDKTKKPVVRNRELERLGVVAPVLTVSDSRRQCTVKKSDNEKSKVLPYSGARTMEDNKSSTSVTDIDEGSTSETDIDECSGSEEEISDDNETEEAMSDSDSEVIIVSEVRGNNSAPDSSKSLEKKSSRDRGGGSEVAGSSTAGSVPLKKPSKQVAAQSDLSALHDGTQELPAPSSSSWWVHKVNVLETTMAEMKARFAEILRQKVIVIVALLRIINVKLQ